jgi:DNA-directed RNA polymerase subunit RPC12/RpoP
MKSHCPSCSRLLLVPHEALGRQARCPACGHTLFAQPSPDAMDQVAFQWLVEDAEAATRISRMALRA